MNNELEAALSGAIAVLAACGLTFAITTALRHNDTAGRLWSGSVIATLGCGLAAVLSDPAFDGLAFDGARLDVLGAACAVVATGLFWSAVRSYRGAPALTTVPLLVTVLLVLVWITIESIGSTLEPTGLIASGGFALLAAHDLRLSPLTGNLNVVALRLLLVAVAAATIIGGALVQPWSATADAEPFASIALVVGVAAMLQCLVAMRAERRGSWWSDDRAEQRSYGAYSHDQFVDAATNRLDRLQLTGGHAGLLSARIEDLAALNAAFGRQGGEAALTALSESLRAHVPAWAVIGHLGAGTFAVLAPIDTPTRISEIAAAVERSLYARSTGSSDDNLPVPVVFGVADTVQTGLDLEALLAAAAPDGQGAVETS